MNKQKLQKGLTAYMCFLILYWHYHFSLWKRLTYSTSVILWFIQLTVLLVFCLKSCCFCPHSCRVCCVLLILSLDIQHLVGLSPILLQIIKVHGSMWRSLLTGNQSVVYESTKRAWEKSQDNPDLLVQIQSLENLWRRLAWEILKGSS